MKPLIPIVVLCLCRGLLAGAQENREALQQLLRADGLRNALVGISVKKAADGTDYLSHCPEMALTPASVAKLMPAWFALQQKGAAYTYCTPVVYTGSINGTVLEGDIIVKASGDPTPDSRYFPGYSLLDAVTGALKQKNIRTVRGRIRVEGARRGTAIPGSWPWEDVSNYYAALCLPFNYRDNLFTLYYRTGEPGTEAELLQVTPDLPEIQIVSEVKAAAGKQDNAWVFGGPHSAVLCVQGTIPARSNSFRVKGALHNPAAVFIHELTQKLRVKGISVEGQQTADTVCTRLLDYQSPPLSEILFHTCKSSVNLFAEALGQLAGGSDWAASAGRLFTLAGLESAGMSLKDACGLSPANAVPAQVLTGLLVYAHSQGAGVFERSLPVAGVDGGLAGYCHAWPQLKSRLRAKTGSMSGVRCLAGYLTRRNGEKLAFTVMVNHYSCTSAQLQRAVGEFLTALL